MRRQALLAARCCLGREHGAAWPAAAPACDVSGGSGAVCISGVLGASVSARASAAGAGQQAPGSAGMARLCTAASSQAEGPPAKGEGRFSWPLIGFLGACAAGCAAAVGTIAIKEDRLPPGLQAQAGAHFSNWSGTHEASPRRLYEPESVEQLRQVLARAHRKGERLRCVGQALSPNGVAFSPEGMLSLAQLDRVLAVDAAARQVRVQAGARVQEVVEALRPHGLTLQNYASIREQSIGGFTQVAAHGTGARIPTVDEQVVALQLETPGEGTLQLSAESQPALFRLARVGLGLLGAVSELTLQCVPAHTLLEHTFVASAKEVRRKHKRWLAEHQHIKYLWIPHTDAVVVVTNDPVPEGTEAPRARGRGWSEAERAAPLRELLAEACGEAPPPDLPQLSATQLRDRLLERAPLDTDWVRRVNEAEAEFWRRSEGWRVGPSDQQLGFDCGGQQWVLEVSLPTGSLSQPSGADMRFMEDLLRLIEERQVPAPSPIEQRWTASSSSPMSPAAAPADAPDTVHSWVGVIMYLPDGDEAARQRITDSFHEYAGAVERELLPRYGAVPHWAKLEVGRQGEAAAQRMLAARFPLADFEAARRRLDPKGILGTRELAAALAPAA